MTQPTRLGLLFANTALLYHTHVALSYLYWTAFQIVLSVIRFVRAYQRYLAYYQAYLEEVYRSLIKTD